MFLQMLQTCVILFSLEQNVKFIYWNSFENVVHFITILYYVLEFKLLVATFSITLASICVFIRWYILCSNVNVIELPFTWKWTLFGVFTKTHHHRLKTTSHDVKPNAFNWMKRTGIDSLFVTQKMKKFSNFSIMSHEIEIVFWDVALGTLVFELAFLCKLFDYCTVSNKKFCYSEYFWDLSPWSSSLILANFKPKRQKMMHCSTAARIAPDS